MTFAHIRWSAYRAGVIILASIISITVFGILITAPSKLGLHSYIVHDISETPWLVVIALPLSLLFLFGPFYAAAWAFRRILALAARLLKKNANGG